MTSPTYSQARKAKTLILALLAVGLFVFLPSAVLGQGSTLERDAYTLSSSPGSNFGTSVRQAPTLSEAFIATVWPKE